MMGHRPGAKSSPRLTAGSISKLLFCWLQPLVWQGKARDLISEDLHDTLPDDLSEQLGGRLEKHWKDEVENARQSDHKPMLVNAIRKTFGWAYFYYAGHMLILSCLRILQPMLLALFIRYFEHDPKEPTTRSQAYLYASILVLLTLLHSLLKHHIDFGTLEIGMRLRIACSSLVYRKIVRLSSSSEAATSAGQLVNLLSNDVARFDPLFVYLHYMWIMPLQGCVIAYLVWRSVGVASLAGVLLMGLESIPVQVYIGKITSRLRAKIAKKTDERVRLMSEIIHGIHVIKMYTWEKPFEQLVTLARRYEIDEITRISYLRGVNIATNAFVDRTCLYFTILAYVLAGNYISADKVFSMVQYFTILQNLLVYNYPRAMANAAEARVSVKRLEKFLLMEEIKIKAPLLSIEENGSISLKNVTASWSPNSIVNTLHDITMYITPKKLHVIAGPVGSGKSSLVHLMLGELRASEGEARISGTISYAPQRPWLFPGSIRDNIVFDQVYDEARYEEVLRVCALGPDLERLPRSDLSPVGERGTNLSGGQCARINLARAVYRDADIYILDDPLVAVDPSVSKYLFNECINGYLKDKTRIFVTHQVHCLKEADTIFLLNNGKLESQGKFDDFSEKELRSLNIDTDEMDERKEAEKIEEMNPETIVIKNVSKDDDQNNILVKSLAADEDERKEPQETEELIAKGKMQSSIFYKYFRSGNSHFLLISTVLFFIMAQAIRSGSDYWLAYWTRQEEIRYAMTNTPFELAMNSTDDNSEPPGLDVNGINATFLPNISKNPVISTTENLISSTVQNLLLNTTEILLSDTMENSPTSTIQSILSNSTESTLLTTLENTSSNAIQNLLPKTAEKLFANFILSNENSDYMDVNVAMIIYGCIMLACVVTAVSKVLLLYKVCMNASRTIHNEMFSCILRAPMRFFDKQTAGQILNRFSKDTGAMDEILPVTLHESIEVFSVIMGVAVQILIINWWSILPMAIAGFLYWKIRNLYIPTAYGIKRLEGAAKSPVLSYVTATLEGLTTIRSSRAQTTVCRRFDARQDAHTRAHFLSIAVASAFGLWLDLVTVILVGFITFGCLYSDESTTFAGSVGLAITQILMLCGMLQRGIRQTAETITQMTSVERILQFTQLEHEESDSSSTGLTKPPSDWPSKGRIEFRNFNLRYADDKEPALKDVNLIIEPGTKVGIVGRTGSGKTSLISALFRLAPAEGQVLIDDLDTRTLPLAELRKRISVIPQQSALFSTSLRDNLDPFHEFEDTSLWAALEDVRLHEAFVPLDHPIECGGRNLSAGQRQLLCLARVMVKKTRILVLDEAMANVDPATDALIHETISDKFKDCTVLTVAHRLESIIDSDLIVVVDKGRLVECGQPHLLLGNEDGFLTMMARQGGEQMLEHLKKVAEEAYIRLNNKILTTDAAEERTNVNGIVRSNTISKTAENLAEEQ